MAVLMIHDSPGGTEEQYDAVISLLSDGKGISSLSDWPVPGILFHAAGPTASGWRVVDVWESEDAFEAFAPFIGFALEDVGFPGGPQPFPLHALVTQP
jgi:hypothetical protein